MQRPLIVLSLLAAAVWAMAPGCSDSASTAGSAGSAGSLPADVGGSPPSAGHGSSSGARAGHAGEATAGPSGSSNSEVGGSSGTSTGSAGSSPLDSWVADEASWEPFSLGGTTFKDCSLSHARPDHLPQGTQLSWSSCGEGCEQLDTTWLGQNANFTSLGMVPVGSEVHPMMGASWGAPPYAVRRLLDLTDGSVKNAMRSQSVYPNVYPKYCGGGWADSAPRYWELAPYANETQESLRYSLWMRADGSLGQTILRPEIKGNVQSFFSEARGGSEFLGADTVRRVDLTKAMPIETLDSGLAFKWGAGQGDLAVWLDQNSTTTQRVRAWAPDGIGARTLLDIPSPSDQAPQSTFIALSDSRIVGRFTHFDSESYNDGLRVWFSPRASTAAGTKLTIGPELPMPPGWTQMIVGPHLTWGDYILVHIATIQADTHIRLVHLPSWTSYTLPPPEGYVLSDHRNITLSGQHAYIGLRDKKTGSTDTTIMRRYDLTKLVQTASVVQPPL